MTTFTCDFHFLSGTFGPIAFLMAFTALLIPNRKISGSCVEYLKKRNGDQIHCHCNQLAMARAFLRQWQPGLSIQHWPPFWTFTYSHTMVLPTTINTTQGDLRSSHNNDPLSERTLVTTWGHGDSRPRHAQSFRDGKEHQLSHARPAGAWKETYVWFIFNASTQCEQTYVTLSNRGLSLRTGSTFSRASRDWDWRTFCG